MATDHIVRSFDDELDQINHTIAEMGGLVERQLSRSVQALSKRDTELAEKVMREDNRIDDLEAEVDQLVVRTIALRQPMADDLRSIISALKIASDLERMGDYAKNIAKRTVAINQAYPIEPARAIPRMSRMVELMLHDVLDAFSRGDAEKALDVWRSDEEVDSLYTSLFRELLTYMMEDSRNITACTHLLFVAKNIERIGDHVTNVAENIHYLATGETLANGRPKRDESSFEVIKS